MSCFIYDTFAEFFFQVFLFSTQTLSKFLTNISIKSDLKHKNYKYNHLSSKFTLK